MNLFDTCGKYRHTVSCHSEKGCDRFGSRFVTGDRRTKKRLLARFLLSSMVERNGELRLAVYLCMVFQPVIARPPVWKLFRTFIKN